jgi:methionine--tRNA ligase beta chain
MPNKCHELLTALGVSEFNAETLSSLNGLTTGFKTAMGAPLFPKMKNLPTDIQVARDRALGIEPTPEVKEAPQTKKIKLKVFQAVPFQSGVISAVTAGDTQTITVDIGTDTNVVILGKQLPTITQDAVGKGVVVVGPTTAEDFEKIELRAGQIVEASGHPEADKLLVMKVDVGEEQPRSIVAGIASRFKPEELINQKVTVVANLKPSKLRGVPSEGMLMAAGGERLQSLVTAGADFKTGTPMNLFGSENMFILIAQTPEGNHIQTLSEATEPGSVVR